MSAHILTSGYWPSYPVLEANLPAELTQYQVQAFALMARRQLIASQLAVPDLYPNEATERVSSLHGHCVDFAYWSYELQPCRVCSRTSICPSTRGGAWCGTTAWAPASSRPSSPKAPRSSLCPSSRSGPCFEWSGMSPSRMALSLLMQQRLWTLPLDALKPYLAFCMAPKCHIYWSSSAAVMPLCKQGTGFVDCHQCPYLTGTLCV